MAAGFVGCTSDPSLSSTADGPSWDDFLASTVREPDTGTYLVDGDLPVRTLAEVRAFYDSRHGGDALVRHAFTVNGVRQLSRWGIFEQRNLTYCVSRSSFGGDHDAVITALTEAAREWERVANVDFIHRVEHDDDCTSAQDNVVFDVRMGDDDFESGTPARAFWPHEPRAARNIVLFAPVFTTEIAPRTLKGILLHQLGHVLGFDHEHLRPEAPSACPDGPNDLAPSTRYDSASVMHYVLPGCGTNRGDYRLTTLDASGAAEHYGEPVYDFTFHDGAAIPVLEGWCSHAGSTLGTADFDGDGDDDLWCHDPIAGSPGRTWVLLVSHGGYRPLPGTSIHDPWLSNWCGSAGETFGVADFDGDARTDLWCRETTAPGNLGRTWVALSTGRGFAAARGSLWDPWLTGWCTGAGTTVATGDFDGDGTADLLCRDPQAGTGAGRIEIALAVGDRFVPEASFGLTAWCTAADTTLGATTIDTDRRSDLWCHTPASGLLQVLYSTGTGFVSGTSSQTGGVTSAWCRADARLGVADVSTWAPGDDFYCLGPSRGGPHAVRALVALGRAFATGYMDRPWVEGWCAALGDRMLTGDFNGDGRADLVCSGATGLRVAVSAGTYAVNDPWTVRLSGFCVGGELQVTDADTGAAGLLCRDPAGPGSLGRIWRAWANIAW